MSSTSISEPVASEPVASETVASETVASEPVASEPVASEPVASEPVASEPVITHIDNIIIGSGPSGLQLAYYFQRDKVPYLLLEKNKIPASFFDTFPHTKQLISINKKHTGVSDPEFNLRHDWNSLLSDKGPWFTDYSDAYYPSRDDLHRYFKDYVNMNNIDIQYESTVTSVYNNNKGYKILCNVSGKEKIYTCNKLIVATGLTPYKPRITNFCEDPILHYAEYQKDYFLDKQNLDKYKNKTLLIIGNGNSAFELANHLNPYCSTINVIGRKPKKWSVSSHYTGDLRAIYTPFFDTFLLKSLNAIDYYHITREHPINDNHIIIDKVNGKYELSHFCENDKCTERHRYTPSQGLLYYDHIILATGWRFDTSMFETLNEPLKSIGQNFPDININWESVSHPNLYFIGTIAQTLDFKKSSGAFIHGFRYLVRYFYQLHYSRVFCVSEIPIIADKRIESLEKITKIIIKQINVSSAMYQMHTMMGDIFFYDENKKSMIFFHDVPVSMMKDKSSPIQQLIKPGIFIFTCTLEYGETHVEEIKKLGRKISNMGSECNSTLLHPVFRVYYNFIQVDEVHLDEDLIARFTSPIVYIARILRLLLAYF